MYSRQHPRLYVNGSVIVSAKVAAMLEQITNIRDVRAKYRGGEEELEATLHALRFAANDYAAFVNERQPTPTSKAETPLSKRYTPEQVAGHEGITATAVRLAIREGRLQATKHDGRWQISEADYQTYRATRAA
jgi:hypothetical protein